MSQKLVLITGVSQGIGNALMRNLLAKSSYKIIGTVRNASDKEKVMQSLVSAQAKSNLDERVTLVNINFLKELQNKQEANDWIKSISADASKHFKNTFTAPNILINNAGIMLKNDENFKNMSTVQLVRDTLKVNFFTPFFLSESLLEISSSSAHSPTILNLGARVCKLSTNNYLKSIPEIGETLKDKVFTPEKSQLTSEDLYQLLTQSVMKNSDYMSAERISKIPAALPDAPYLVSKVFLHALTKIEGTTRQNAQVNAVDPGWVNTRLTSFKAPLTPDKAAQNILQLLDTPLQNGLLYGDGKLITYV